MARGLVFILCTVAILGCQKPPSTSSASPQVVTTEAPPAQPASPPPPTPRPYTEQVGETLAEAIEKGYRNQTTGESERSNGGHVNRGYCAKGVDCTNKFVSIGINFPNGDVGACSGVAVSKNLVLTNRHCVKPITEKANSGFRGGNLLIGYPQPSKNDHGEGFGIHFASNVVLMSPTDVPHAINSPDWALISLTKELGMKMPEGYRIPKMNRDGFKEGETYFVYSKPASAAAADEQAIEKRACRAIYKTVFAPWFDRPQLPVVLLADCPIGPGNSGSPIYNKKGELVGIIGGQFSPQLLEILSNIAHGTFGLLTEKPFQPMGWGMPLSCIPDLDHPDLELPADCNQGPSSLTAQVELPQFDDIAKQLGDRAPSNVFRFETVRANMNGTAVQPLTQALVLSVPSCLLSGATLEKSVIVNASGLIVNEFGVLQSTPAAKQTLPVDFKIDEERFAREGSAPYELFLLGSKFGIHRGVLSRCP
jgi:hypothetical protein